MMPEINTIVCGDCLDIMRGWPDGCVQCCVTSPPYWGLRNYGVAGQLGLEKTPQEYVEKMVAVFREVRRVLRDDGTLWLNLGDSYCSQGGPQVVNSCNSNRLGGSNTQNGGKSRLPVGGLKPKDLIGIPWRVAFALQADGWYLRQDIIWHKPNPMPESVTDRCTKAHEYIFLLAKSEKYFYDYEAIKEDADPRYESRYDYGFNEGEKEKQGCGRPDAASNTPGMKAFTGLRNKRSVWTVTTKPFADAHFATFPEDLIIPCILAGCPEGGTVLDPFMGAGTVARVCLRAGRQFLGCELNPKYIAIAQARIDAERRQIKLF